MVKAFASKHAPRIWEDLYTVLIPDRLTLGEDYLRVRGVHSTGNRELDRELMTSLTTVMIPISKILEYFDSGIEIQIPSRADMIKMHKSIEMYLEEWKDHIKYDVNLNHTRYKDLILSLEKLSSTIYAKGRRSEVIDDLKPKKSLGLVSPFHSNRQRNMDEVTNKPDYEGISELIRSTNKPISRY